MVFFKERLYILDLWSVQARETISQYIKNQSRTTVAVWATKSTMHSEGWDLLLNKYHNNRSYSKTENAV